MEKLRPGEVKELAQGLTALGGGAGPNPQQHDIRTKLLTTGGAVGSSPRPGSAFQLGLIHASFLPSIEAARPGVDRQCSPSLRAAWSITQPGRSVGPQGAALNQNGYVWGSCDYADKRGTQKLYLLKQQN